MNTLNAPIRISDATSKMVVVGILILVCTIPSFLVFGLVGDRQMRKDEASSNVVQTWGQSQEVAGPALSVPFLIEMRDEKKKVTYSQFQLSILAKHTDIKTELTTQVKRRGIFRIPVYTAAVTMNGTFELPRLTNKSAALADAAVDIRLQNPDAVEVSPKLVWDGKEIALQPFSAHNGSLSVRALVQLPERLRNESVAIPFTYTVTLRGTRALSFLPSSLDLTSMVTSNWKSPSFMGALLPRESAISKDGFSATWNASSQFTLQNTWVQDYPDALFQAQPFGVELFDPVDVYTLTSRALKYAILFIALTFMVFFLVETMNGVRVHPFQYILVGAGIGLFYLLLLSLAEHIGFLSAYLISALAIVGLITWYCAQILRKTKFAVLVGSLLSLLYLYLFTLLQMEDYALLFGSIMLFVILASVMFVTRKVDWYGGKQHTAS